MFNIYINQRYFAPWVGVPTVVGGKFERHINYYIVIYNNLDYTLKATIYRKPKTNSERSSAIC